MAYQSQDTWSNDYDYLVDLSHQIQTKLRRRGGGAQREISTLLTEYKDGINSLKRLVNHRSISERERQQRQRQLDELTDKLDQFNRSLTLNSHDSLSNEDGPRSRTGGTGPGLGQRMSVEEIQAKQRQIIAEQDRGLDAISAALRRQQKVGLSIQDEVTEHNVIIDDISAGTTRADARIKRETQRVEERRKKEKTWCTCMLWTVVIVLAIAIIVISAVPT